LIELLVINKAVSFSGKIRDFLKPAIETYKREDVVRAAAEAIGWICK
jgi:hypothetical protein